MKHRKNFQTWAITFLMAVAIQVSAQNNGPVSKWEKSIASFEQHDQKNSIQKGGNLFIGSSSFTIWRDVQEYFPGRKITNRGFGGSQTSDLWQFRDRLILPYEPSQVIIYVGENDIAAEESPRQVVGEGIELIEWVISNFPEARVAFVSMKPSLKRWHLKDQMQEANKKYEKYARKNDNVNYINVWDAMLGDDGTPRKDIFLEDGLHMNKNGYAIWQSIFDPFLK
ncbi:MAG: GDSL-type esterase/lipase family protein [Cyclobacteriaceae bacterium]